MILSSSGQYVVWCSDRDKQGQKYWGSRWHKFVIDPVSFNRARDLTANPNVLGGSYLFQILPVEAPRL